jgi:inorganic pyrophosphatase/exopolyphosphatase
MKPSFDMAFSIALIERGKGNMDFSGLEKIEEIYHHYNKFESLKNPPLLLKKWTVSDTIKATLYVVPESTVMTSPRLSIVYSGKYVYKVLHTDFSYKFLMYTDEAIQQMVDEHEDEIKRLDHYDKHFFDVEKRDKYEH